MLWFYHDALAEIVVDMTNCSRQNLTKILNLLYTCLWKIIRRNHGAWNDQFTRNNIFGCWLWIGQMKMAKVMDVRRAKW